MRYAVSEKGVLEQKAVREQSERKLLDALKEKDLVQHKLASMVQEKARICQLLDNKVTITLLSLKTIIPFSNET